MAGCSERSLRRAYTSSTGPSSIWHAAAHGACCREDHPSHSIADSWADGLSTPEEQFRNSSAQILERGMWNGALAYIVDHTGPQDASLRKSAQSRRGAVLREGLLCVGFAMLHDNFLFQTSPAAKIRKWRAPQDDLCEYPHGAELRSSTLR